MKLLTNSVHAQRTILEWIKPEWNMWQLLYDVFLSWHNDIFFFFFFTKCYEGLSLLRISLPYELTCLLMECSNRVSYVCLVFCCFWLKWFETVIKFRISAYSSLKTKLGLTNDKIQFYICFTPHPNFLEVRLFDWILKEPKAPWVIT